MYKHKYCLDDCIHIHNYIYIMNKNLQYDKHIRHKVVLGYTGSVHNFME